MLKSYFCKQCGREYNYSEALRNGTKLYCFNCPKIQLRITGMPLILVGIFLGLMYFIYKQFQFSTQFDKYLFMPASIGLVLVGILRMLQARAQQRKHAELLARLKAEEDEAAEAEELVEPTANTQAEAAQPAESASETPESEKGPENKAEVTPRSETPQESSTLSD